MSQSSRLALFVTLALAAVPAQADTIIVTTDSGGTGGPDCTLRDAITASKFDTPTGGCPAGSGADTIELPTDAAILLTEVDNDTGGPNGLPSVIMELTINGNGTTIQRQDSAPFFRIFHVSSNGTLMLNSLTLSGGGGDGPLNGGGIRNNGTLTLSSSIVSGNSAVGAGGILNSGMLTLTNSTVSENSVTAIGGGIINYESGTTILINSTVSYNNNANIHGSGGGIRNAGTLSLINSTVSGNTTGAYGGGIVSVGTLTLTNSTVSGNTGGLSGGGIWNDNTLTLTNSIVINNTASLGGGIGNFSRATAIVTDTTICGNTPDQIRGPWTDNGGNLIEDECPPCPPIDLNGDGFVGASDLAQLLANWGPCEGCSADFDGDGEVGPFDLATLLAAWGLCP